MADNSTTAAAHVAALLASALDTIDRAHVRLDDISQNIEEREKAAKEAKEYFRKMVELRDVARAMKAALDAHGIPLPEEAKSMLQPFKGDFVCATEITAGSIYAEAIPTGCVTPSPVPTRSET